MLPGQLSRLTDKELLSYLQDVTHYSPVIAELVKRLESHTDAADISKLHHKVECPVCMANLQVDIDWGNNMFTVKTVTV